MAMQAKLMEERLKAGGLKKKGPLIKKEQEVNIFFLKTKVKKFDSADY